MTHSNQITASQQRRFYREAVKASLQEFYGKSDSESRRLVREWWKRLTLTGSMESGLFLHAEPINTAAGIAGADVVAITSKTREAYHRILASSRTLAATKFKRVRTGDLAAKPKHKVSRKQVQVAGAS